MPRCLAHCVLERRARRRQIAAAELGQSQSVVVFPFRVQGHGALEELNGPVFAIEIHIDRSQKRIDLHPRRIAGYHLFQNHRGLLGPPQSRIERNPQGVVGFETVRLHVDGCSQGINRLLIAALSIEFNSRFIVVCSRLVIPCRVTGGRRQAVYLDWLLAGDQVFCIRWPDITSNDALFPLLYHQVAPSLRSLQYLYPTTGPTDLYALHFLGCPQPEEHPTVAL